MQSQPPPLRPITIRADDGQQPDSKRGNHRWRGLFLRTLLIGTVALVIFSSGAVAGLLIDQSLGRSGAAAGSSGVPSAFQEAWTLVHDRYVDTKAIDDQKLTNGAISGMLDALGDTGHTRYLDPAALQQHQQSLSGSFVGVGIQIEQQNNQIVIVAPLDDSPALKAGIESGDILEKVDGTDVSGMSLNDVSDKVRGPEGSTVNLTLQRPSTNQAYTVALRRSTIKINPVSWQMLPDQIADIRLSEFSDGAAKDLAQAIQAAQAAGAKSIIFDLRNDPGGLVNEADDVASELLQTGQPIYISQTRGGEQTVNRTSDSTVRTTLPLVVLVNKGSASAAEIVSGALKDDGRAKVIGETTFGTGTVLNQFNLSNGGAILLGTELWLTPNGQLIRDHGITPDITVTLPSGQDPYIPLPNGQTEQQLPSDDQLAAAWHVLHGDPISSAGPSCGHCN